MTLPSLDVREYRPTDLDGCVEVLESNVPEFFRDHERSEYREFLADLPGPYLVVSDGRDRIVACGGYAASTRAVVDLCWGMVRRDLHGQGLGRMLTKARLDRALADPSVESVALSTSQLTTGFYERLGFRIVEVRPDGYGPGLDRCDMRLDLTPDR